MGKLSRTIQERLPARPIFQTYRPVSIADHGHGSSFGSSRTPCKGSGRIRATSLVRTVGGKSLGVAGTACVASGPRVFDLRTRTQPARLAALRGIHRSVHRWE